jgi:pyrimidine operon attenuation protein/uracil phosphoribosyltransferase
MPKIFLDGKEMERAITRMGHEIIERNRGPENLCLVGIQRGGVHLAKRLAAVMGATESRKIPVGSLDISFYRDDIHIRKSPAVSKTEIPCEVDGKIIVLVDDVFFTGRSIRAAMDAIMDMGRPSMIQLAVLVDRGHRELPIRADFAGRNIPTSASERVEVLLKEDGHEDSVMLLSAEELK